MMQQQMRIIVALSVVTAFMSIIIAGLVVRLICTRQRGVSILESGSRDSRPTTAPSQGGGSEHSLLKQTPLEIGLSVLPPDIPHMNVALIGDYSPWLERRNIIKEEKRNRQDFTFTVYGNPDPEDEKIDGTIFLSSATREDFTKWVNFQGPKMVVGTDPKFEEFVGYNLDTCYCPSTDPFPWLVEKLYIGRTIAVEGWMRAHPGPRRGSTVRVFSFSGVPAPPISVAT
jgi:hypothetical protein